MTSSTHESLRTHSKRRCDGARSRSLCAAVRPELRLGRYSPEQRGSFVYARRQHYQPFGQLASIGSVKENGELVPESLEFVLPGVDGSLITTTLTENYVGRAVTLWVAYLDDNLQFVATPQIIWEGLMDQMNIQRDEKTATIQLICESRLIRWNRPAGWLYTHEHQRLIDSTDDFLNYVALMVNRVLKWGGFPVAPGHPRTPGDRDRGGKDEGHQGAEIERSRIAGGLPGRDARARVRLRNVRLCAIRCRLGEAMHGHRLRRAAARLLIAARGLSNRKVFGSLEAMVTHSSDREPIAPAFAMRGDIVLASLDTDEGESRDTIGICEAVRIASSLGIRAAWSPCLAASCAWLGASSKCRPLLLAALRDCGTTAYAVIYVIATVVINVGLSKIAQNLSGKPKARRPARRAATLLLEARSSLVSLFMVRSGPAASLPSSACQDLRTNICTSS
jgi:hypothetical protein